MGRDKGKGGRGGGRGGRGGGKKMYIANMDELQMRDEQVREQQQARARRRDEDDDDDEDDEEAEEEEVGNEAEDASAPVSGEKSTIAEGEPVTVFQRMSRAEAAAARAAKSGGGASGEVAPAAPAAPAGGEGLLTGAPAVNPNRAIKPTEKMIKVKDMNSVQVDANPEAGMNRKQREVLASERAKEEHLRRYRAGETEQARKDLERLAIIRQKREEQAKLRAAAGRAPGWKPPDAKSNVPGSDSDSDSGDSDEDDEDESDDDEDEEEAAMKGGKISAKSAAKKAAAFTAQQAEKSAAIQAKKKAAALGTPEAATAATSGGDASSAAATATSGAKSSSASSGPAKLKSMDIKKMNGDALKDHLKERNLSVQGAKKDLIKRLTDFEAARA